MISNLSKLDEINVLASEVNWAWPQALREIFQPRGVNLLVAADTGEFVDTEVENGTTYDYRLSLVIEGTTALDHRLTHCHLVSL